MGTLYSEMCTGRRLYFLTQLILLDNYPVCQARHFQRQADVMLVFKEIQIWQGIFL